MNTPTLDQIHDAMVAKLAAVDESKAELARAIRKCCRDLSIGFPLTVGEHVVKRIVAECSVIGGRATEYSRLHEKRILLIDDQVVDEPAFTATHPDPREHNWLAEFHGPVDDGWYVVGAWDRYSSLRDKLEDGPPWAFDSLKKPCMFGLCELTAMREVAADLPKAMSRWQSEKFVSLDDEVRQTEQATAALLSHCSAT